MYITLDASLGILLRKKNEYKMQLKDITQDLGQTESAQVERADRGRVRGSKGSQRGLSMDVVYRVDEKDREEERDKDSPLYQPH